MQSSSSNENVNLKKIIKIVKGPDRERKKVLPCDEANDEVEHTNHVFQMDLSQEQLK